MTDDAHYEGVVREFLEMVDDLSSKAYQVKTWIRGIGPECYDYTEAVCVFFDVETFLLKKYGEYPMTQEQYLALLNFRNAFNTFVDSDLGYWPPEFINSAEWKEIRRMANETLDLFPYYKRRHPKDSELLEETENAQ